MLVTNHQTRAVVFSGKSGLVHLLPGVNELHDEDAAILSANIAPLKLEEAGLIEFGDVKKSGKDGAVTVGKTLADLSPEEAETTIKAVNDIKLLEKWKRGEKRDDIRLHLVNRIEEIKNYKGPESEEEA